jgi:hypothetical protein
MPIEGDGMETVTDDGRYTETTGTLAHATGKAQRTIVDYCDEGLLDYITLPNGMRLLRLGQEQRVHEVYARRLANRGRRPAAAA